jgi:hypothetical protein
MVVWVLEREVFAGKAPAQRPPVELVETSAAKAPAQPPWVEPVESSKKS